MEKITKEQYNMMLERIEELLPELDVFHANQLLDETFQIKPVRLKWYLLKAQVMLKEGTRIEEIIEFLSDKCHTFCLYDGVEEYFELLCALCEYQGDKEEELRYQYQRNKLREVFVDSINRNEEIDFELENMEKEIAMAKDLTMDKIERLSSLYYISGNIYLYFLWQCVLVCCYHKTNNPKRKWVSEQYNVEFFHDRLISNEKEIFVVLQSDEISAERALLTAKALRLLKKEVIIVDNLILWEGDFDSAVKASIQSLRQEEEMLRISAHFVVNGGDVKHTRLNILDYISKNIVSDEYMTVLTSGLLLDQLVLTEEWKPRIERLTEAYNDYFEDKVAIGRYGDYLSYIGRIYHMTRTQTEHLVNKKPTCRFSLIIPCRNAGNTLLSTLKTCLNQNFEGDYEIIVSDNSEAALGEHTPTYQICQQLNDKKIKYYRTPEELSLPRNFEYAFLMANGEFLISMGADDGICPWALKELDGILDRYADEMIFLWHEAFYKWADVSSDIMEYGGTAVLNVQSPYEKGSPKVFSYRTEPVFQEAFNDYGQLYYLPQLYHNSGIRRGYLAVLYEKTGMLWGGTPQDICMAVINANINNELYFVDNLLTITGISNLSIGANVRVGNSDLMQKPISKRLNFLPTNYRGAKAHVYTERLLPGMGVESAAFYSSVLRSHALGIISDELLKSIDWKNMYGRVVRQILRGDTRYDYKIHRLRYAVSLLGEEMLEWFDKYYYNELLSPVFMNVNDIKKDEKSKIYEEKITIEGKSICAESGSISDIYNSALFLQRYFEEHSSGNLSI